MERSPESRVTGRCEGQEGFLAEAPAGARLSPRKGRTAQLPSSLRTSTFRGPAPSQRTRIVTGRPRSRYVPPIISWCAGSTPAGSSPRCCMSPGHVVPMRPRGGKRRRRNRPAMVRETAIERPRPGSRPSARGGSSWTRARRAGGTVRGAYTVNEAALRHGRTTPSSRTPLSRDGADAITRGLASEPLLPLPQRAG
jgi:hypothetical protein